jgi:hypothetical protein
MFYSLSSRERVGVRALKIISFVFFVSPHPAMYHVGYMVDLLPRGEGNS